MAVALEKFTLIVFPGLEHICWLLLDRLKLRVMQNEPLRERLRGGSFYLLLMWSSDADLVGGYG